ncbi:MAG: hypothetical protein K2N78_13245 [Oscillospiraceae bacterium]|nr:hypothetical protein [Oscillospiraceae bacterium]
MEQVIKQQRSEQTQQSKASLTGIPVQENFAAKHFGSRPYRGIQVHYSESDSAAAGPEKIFLHQNSKIPARYGANAVLQGRHIYVMSGRESSIPHEIAHIELRHPEKAVPTRFEHGTAICFRPDWERQADILALDLDPSDFQIEDVSGDTLTDGKTPLLLDTKKLLLQRYKNETKTEALKRHNFSEYQRMIYWLDNSIKAIIKYETLDDNFSAPELQRVISRILLANDGQQAILELCIEILYTDSEFGEQARAGLFSQIVIDSGEENLRIIAEAIDFDEQASFIPDNLQFIKKILSLQFASLVESAVDTEMLFSLFQSGEPITNFFSKNLPENQTQGLIEDMANILGSYGSFEIGTISFDKPDQALEQLFDFFQLLVEQDSELLEDDILELSLELSAAVLHNITVRLSKCTWEDLVDIVDKDWYCSLICEANLRPILLKMISVNPQSIVNPAFDDNDFLSFVEEYLKTNSAMMSGLITSVYCRFADDADIMSTLVQVIQCHISEYYEPENRLLALQLLREVMLSWPEQDDYPTTLAEIRIQLCSKDNWLTKWRNTLSDQQVNIDESFFQMVCSVLEGYWEFAKRDGKVKSLALWPLQPRHIIPHSDIKGIISVLFSNDTRARTDKDKDKYHEYQEHAAKAIDDLIKLLCCERNGYDNKIITLWGQLSDHRFMGLSNPEVAEAVETLISLLANHPGNIFIGDGQVNVILVNRFDADKEAVEMYSMEHVEALYNWWTLALGSLSIGTRWNDKNQVYESEVSRTLKGPQDIKFGQICFNPNSNAKEESS